MTQPVLALYDCRSKQEYIYRTNRMKEISGGSALLSDLFREFFNHGNCGNLNIRTDWRDRTEVSGDFVEDFKSGEYDGEVLYEGGGNLLVIYKNKEICIEANKRLSRFAIDKTYSVSVIASFTDVTDNFVKDRQQLYIQNGLNKNQGLFFIPNVTLPFSKLDRLTYMPVVKTEGKKDFTYESLLKNERYERDEKSYTETKELDDMTDKGNDSLLCIIYIDGNNMGDKVKECTQNADTYAKGVSALRKLSVETDEAFVNRPVNAIKDYLSAQRKNDPDHPERYLSRVVISGGDEITIVCNAHLAMDVLDVYFETLSQSENNSACAGCAVFHSHTPFAQVYEIAEQCCESGKEFAHENKGKSYIDFHFCHSGITNDLKTIRNEQDILTQPYEVGGSWEEFKKLAEELRPIGRANIKNLSTAIFKGESYYREELVRLANLDSKRAVTISENDDTKRMISDISAVYDIWFRGGDDECTD